MKEEMKKRRKKICVSVSISFPMNLLDLIDGKVNDGEFTSRSEFIIEAAREKIHGKK